jgi:ABC-type polysaccharide/polyol phosphate export permease
MAQDLIFWVATVSVCMGTPITCVQRLRTLPNPSACFPHSLTVNRSRLSPVKKRKVMKDASRTPKLRLERRGFFMLGIADLLRGIHNWRLCHLIGLGEIRRRYARSRIGQFWLTISTGIAITTLGLVWSTLWKLPIADLMPYVAVSSIVWTMISGALGDATTVFTSTGPIFLNQGMSFSTAIYSLIYRHLLIFLHNVPIIMTAILFFSVPAGGISLVALPGFGLLVIALVWMSYLVAIACVRFRDLTQIVQSCLMIAFFITPILWKPDQIPPDRQYLLFLNPFVVLLAVIREPLLGQLPTIYDWTAAALFSIGGSVLALPIIGYCQRRIIYWI